MTIQVSGSSYRTEGRVDRCTLARTGSCVAQPAQNCVSARAISASGAVVSATAQTTTFALAQAHCPARPGPAPPSADTEPLPRARTRTDELTNKRQRNACSGSGSNARWQRLVAICAVFKGQHAVYARLLVVILFIETKLGIWIAIFLTIWVEYGLHLRVYLFLGIKTG